MTHKCYSVLLPFDLLEEGEPYFGPIVHNGIKWAIIDEVYHTGDAEDVRVGLIDHDGYNPSILVVSAERM